MPLGLNSYHLLYTPRHEKYHIDKHSIPNLVILWMSIGEGKQENTFGNSTFARILSNLSFLIGDLDLFFLCSLYLGNDSNSQLWPWQQHGLLSRRNRYSLLAGKQQIAPYSGGTRNKWAARSCMRMICSTSSTWSPASRRWNVLRCFFVLSSARCQSNEGRVEHARLFRMTKN